MDRLTIRGYVVDPDGRPIARADVYALRTYWQQPVEREPLNHVATDADGQFSISFRKSQYVASIGRPDEWRNTRIAALVDGYGPAWVAYRDLAAGEPLVLRLAADGVPIEGRVIDLEGRPIEGVHVELESIAAPCRGGRTGSWPNRLKSVTTVSQTS